MNILVLLGTSHLSFERLTDVLINIKGHEIYVQHGHTNLDPRITGSAFMTREDLFRKINWSDMVISQGGVGSVMDVLDCKKPVIIVPRQEQFKELVGDQIIFSDFVASLGLARVCYNPENLENYLTFFNKPCSGITIDYSGIVGEIKKLI